MLETPMKMVPKWSQNLSKIDPGGALEATWEPPLKQGASKTSFLTILAPFWDPLWDQFGVILGIFFVVFLKGLFDGLGLHLSSQNTSKMKPKRGSKPKPEFHRFCCYLQYMSHIRGPENHHLLLFFGNTILGWLLEPILVILAHFWDPFWRQCSSLFGYHVCIDF